MSERAHRETGLAGLLDIALGSLPAVVAFLVFPVELYLRNQGELNYRMVVLAPYAALCGVWGATLALVLRVMASAWRTRTVHALFWLGVFLLLSDIIAPVQLGLLDGREVRPPEPLGLTIRELLLAAVIVAAALKIPVDPVRLFGVGLVLVLVVLQPVRLLGGDRQQELQPPPAVPTSAGNVYHLTFDSYHGRFFKAAAAETDTAGKFDGFVFFANARSNYVYTGLSMASFMTGTFYESGSFRRWLRAPFERGLTEELSRQGFTVSYYAHSSGYVHRRASHVRTNVGLMADLNLAGLFTTFADLWLVRLVPNALQDEVYDEGKGFFTRLHEAVARPLAGPSRAVAEQEARAYYSVALARALIEEEKRRPATGQYVYAHIYLPHGAYIMDEHCQYAPGRADFRSQTLCATRLMAEFIDELKRLGRYRTATIILQSDHTHGGLEQGPPVESIRNVQQLRDNVWRVEPAVLDSMTRVLLLVKPPGREKVPLETSERPAQLVDIPATMFDLLGIVPQAPPPHGRSLFAADFPAQRESPLYLGYRQTDANGRYLFVGRDFREGELNRFGYSTVDGWKRYPNVPVRW